MNNVITEMIVIIYEEQTALTNDAHFGEPARNRWFKTESHNGKICVNGGVIKHPLAYKDTCVHV